MKIESVFENGEKIPVKYTADGDDISPPLTIYGIPEKTERLVLIVDDPDAPVGNWVHWVLFNVFVKGDKLEIEEDSVPSGGVLGKNDFGKLEYGGPAPPSGVHRYFFKVYALDRKIDLEKGVTKAEVEKAMNNYILDEGILFGIYSR